MLYRNVELQEHADRGRLAWYQTPAKLSTILTTPWGQFRVGFNYGH